MSDVIINKVAAIKRCLARIEEEFTSDAEFKTNFTKQDSIILNLQRACEAAIDISNYLIKHNSLGVPQSARDSFDLLTSAGIISQEQATNLKRMVGLRNVAVHNYQTLDLDIVIAVLNKHLAEFDAFCNVVMSI